MVPLLTLVPAPSQSFTDITEPTSFTCQPRREKLVYFHSIVEHTGGRCCKDGAELFTELCMKSLISFFLLLQLRSSRDRTLALGFEKCFSSALKTKAIALRAILHSFKAF